MAYPPIPRDPKGVPLPVVWDDGVQNWKIYTGQVSMEAINIIVRPEDLNVEVGTVRQGDIVGSAPWAFSEATITSNPVTGSKTVTSTVAEIFAGSSRKANRRKMIVRNLHPSVPARVGGTGITDAIGQLLEPGASVELDFHPNQVVPIYAVSTAGNVLVEVIEV